MKEVKKNTRYNVLTILLTFAFFFWSGLASAACSQADLKGQWRFTGVSGDTYFGAMAESNMCKLNLASSGYIIASSSSCLYRSAEGFFNFPPIVGGKLKVNSGCWVRGEIVFWGGARMIIDPGTALDRGKTVMTAVGFMNVDPDIIISLTGVKN